jgi:hypothetical protein
MPAPDSPLQQMPKWVRRYAQNQTIPVLVFLIAFTVLFASISGFSYLAGRACRAGQHPRFLLFLAGVIVSVVANLWFSVPRWGGRWVARTGQRFYSQEGQVQLSSPKPTGAMRFVTIGFGLCLLAFISASILGFVNARYMQPASALVVVPFLMFMILVQRSKSGYLMLLWPGLYAVHAILILAGAPILFQGRWDVLNMLIPTAGYGLFAAAVAHLYSRYALFRLKRLARQPVPVGGDDLA